MSIKKEINTVQTRTLCALSKPVPLRFLSPFNPVVQHGGDNANGLSGYGFHPPMFPSCSHVGRTDILFFAIYRIKNVRRGRFFLATGTLRHRNRRAPLRRKVHSPGAAYVAATGRRLQVVRAKTSAGQHTPNKSNRTRQDKYQ